MATSDLRQFYFYQDYIWTPSDFANMQTWIWGAFQSAFEGAFNQAVLSGLRALPGGGLNVNVDPGVAVGSEGQVMVVPTQLVAAIPIAIGNPTRNLIVLRPTSTDMTNIPTPDNPSIMVPLHAKKGLQLVVIAGTPAATPVYPAIQNGDCVVAGIRLAAGQTTITRADMDLGVISRPRKKPITIKQVSSGYTADPTVDEVIEFDAIGASGIVQLPAAGGVEGMKVAVIKVDSSANQVAVSGNGAELISGQNVQYLDSQWDRATLYSTGLAWRIL